MGTGKLIFIRTDANKNIASGHAMRCLTIARALRELGHHVTFLVSDEESVNFLTSQSEASLLCLSSDYHNLENELPQLLSLLKKEKPYALLLDSYFASRHYMESVKAVCPLVYLDDLQQFSYPADLIINYDIHTDAAFYGDTPVLLGTPYTPLREQFCQVPYEVKKEVSEILISTGGTDPDNSAARIFESFSASRAFSSKKLTFHILTGSMNPNKTSLYALSKKEPRLIIHENIEQVASLMSSCDLALSAGGTTLFELCAVGVPTLSFSVSDAQYHCVHAFSDAGIIPYSGDVREGAAFYERLLSMSIKIAESHAARVRLSARMKQFVDGQGAQRIAEAILSVSLPDSDSSREVCNIP